MLVHFVTDNANKIPALRATLEPRHAVETYLLEGAEEHALSNGVLLVDADLRKTFSIERLKAISRKLQRISERLFVVPGHHPHHIVAQALALGATAVVSRPREIVVKLAQAERAQKALESESSGEPTEVAN